jgi:hypothetical protein
LFSPSTDIEGLRTFSQKDFHQFPQIKTEDKDKVAQIIRKVSDETLGLPTNIIPGAEQSSNPAFEMNSDENQWANLDFLDTNTNLEFTKHPFN